MTIPTDPAIAGYNAFFAHRRCALLQAYLPAETAETAEGIRAIKLWHGPEDQGATAMQIQRPHDAWRVEWCKGWDRARKDAEAGKADVEAS